jgi:hypothetical protein
MAIPLEPGVFERGFAAVAAEAQARSRKSVQLMTNALETQAKINASNGAHSVNTPTPAAEGTGPAVVSGTLRRTISHTPTVAIAGGWSAMVGMVPGFWPPYAFPKRHYKPHPLPPADSARYAYYLEFDDWGRTYPFMGPARDFVELVAGPVILRELFGAPWPAFG